MPDWLKPQLLLIAVIGVLAAGSYFAVRWYTSDPLQDVEVQSLEAAWADAIAKYGLEPVFPPQEDLAVGDLLAVVVADDDTDPESEDKKVDRRSPLLKRSAKLAHIDVRPQLDAAYEMIPAFPLSESPLPVAKPGAIPGEALPSKSSSVTRLFTAGVREGDLPRAAFSSLKIQGVNSAAAGFAAGSRGSTNFAASREALEELHLAEVSTYGLPSVRALEILTAYCTDEKTKNHCLESTARKHLQPIVGDRVNLEYVDDKGNNRHAITVEIVIVSRVYLTRSITHLRRANSAQSGGARIAGPITQDDGAKVANDPPAPSPPGGEVADATAVALRKRIDELEKQLSQMRTGGAISRESSSGSEILLKEKLDRPVAFAYRSIRYKIDENENQK